LCFTGKYLDCCDSIDFALGLRDYDLSLLQPHFPGYPIYIFISRLFFKFFPDEVWALVLPGVFFGSLTVYPLSFLARHLFSEKVAILTAILYLLNPLCWLQAERPTSDAEGLFFIMLSAYFLYRAFNSNVREIPTIPVGHLRPHLRLRGFNSNVRWNDRNCLFLGSLTLGLGLGVRLSYFPFIAGWIGILTYLAVQRINLNVQAILYGLMGLATGVCLWLFPQIGYVGWRPFLQNGLSFSYGHFTDWGGSLITFCGLERITCLAKSIWVCGLGGWWYDSSFARLIPSLIIIITLSYTFKQYHFDRRGQFLGAYLIPYLFWVILGQNVANPRHIMPIIPILLILIAYGLCKAHQEGYKGVSLLFTWVLIVSMSIISFKLVIQYHNNAPAPVQLIQFIERKFNNISTRIYCSNEKRFFDYYAPAWDVRKVRNGAELNIDLKSSLGNPQNILVVHTLEEAELFGVTHPPIIKLDGNPYTDGVRKGLLLYALTNL
jgi:4-amino-4-deoxy-L-arabinose transferase-like glycosyltransferase